MNITTLKFIAACVLALSFAVYSSAFSSELYEKDLQDLTSTVKSFQTGCDCGKRNQGGFQ